MTLVRKVFAVALVVCLGAAAWADVEVTVTGVSSGGTAVAKAYGTSRGGADVKLKFIAMSGPGGRVESRGDAKGSGRARVEATGAAVTQSGVAIVRNHATGRGAADVVTDGVAESIDSEAVAKVTGKGVAHHKGKASVDAHAGVRGEGTSTVEAIAKAKRRAKAITQATGVVDCHSRPGRVDLRVKSFARKPGRATVSGEAYDCD